MGSLVVGVTWPLIVLISGMGQAAPTPRDDPGSCLNAACHGEFSARAVVHGPIASGTCESCHELTDAAGHKFQMTSEGAELCTQCHDEDDFDGKFRHDPVADGACLICHDPHGSAIKSLLKGASTAAVCAECHESTTGEKTYLHGPVASGTCTVCHNAHASDHSGLLVAEGRALCLKCHEHLQSQLNNGSLIHAPVEQSCTACHDPHGADNAMMLTAAPPALCYSCHDDVANAVDEAEVPHAPLKGENACGHCHVAHASDHPHMLSDEPSAVCLSCHGDDIKTASGILPGMKAMLAGNMNRHGPVAEGQCTSCHSDVHGGSRFRLLGAAYPRQTYTAYDESQYALCFNCHDADAISEPKTEKLTAFRNGDRNLHQVHVAREVKGRTCRMCHTVHSSNGPKLVAQAVPFGQWSIPIVFEATQTGGSCQTGCHRPYRYDRESPVANVPRG